MRMPFHPAALDELLAAVDWYEQRERGLGGDLLEEIEAAMDVVSEAPERWPLIHEESGTRGYLVSRFPYRILYRRWRDGWRIIAIAHSSRQPDYWRERR